MPKRTTSPVMTFAEAASMIGRKFGFKPSVSTVWRWAKKGIDGQVLEAIRIGRRYRTTPEAIERFLNRLTEDNLGAGSNRTGSRPPPRTGLPKTQWTEARAAVARETEEAKRRLSKYRSSRKPECKGGAR